MTRFLALLASLFALALVAGCGDDEDTDKSSTSATTATTATSSTTPASVGQYKSEITQISNEFASAGTGFRDSVSAKSTPQQAATALAAFQRKVVGLGGRMDGLDPPGNAAAPHRALSSSFRDIAAACQPSIDAGREGDRTKLRTALLGLQSKLNGSLGARAKQAASQIDQALAAQ